MSFRQLQEVLTTLLEQNPRGLRSTNLLRFASNYAHKLDMESMKLLVSRMPEVATWHKSDTYAEYDVVKLANTSWLDRRKGLSLGLRKQEWQDRLYQRFSQWYGDAYPELPPGQSRRRVFVLETARAHAG